VVVQVLRAYAKLSSPRRKDTKIGAVAELSLETAGHAPAVPATLARVPPEQSPLKDVDPAQPSVDDPPCSLAEDAPAVRAPVGHVSANRSSVGHPPTNGSSIGNAPIGHSSVGHAPAEYESFKRATASARRAPIRKTP